MSEVGKRRDGAAPPVSSFDAAVKDFKLLRGSLKATHAAATGLATNKGQFDAAVHLNLKATYLKQIEKYGDELRTTGGIKTTGTAAGKAFAVAGLAAGIGGLAVAVKNGDFKGLVSSLAEVGSVFKDLANQFERLPGAAKILAQVGGVSAVVTGLISAGNTIAEAQRNGWSLEKGLNLASSALRVVSGACLALAPVFPPLAGISAVAGVASAALGVSAMVAGNWDTIKQGAATAANWLESKAGTVVEGYQKAIGFLQSAFWPQVPAGEPGG
jgi:hypothetical protein